MSLEYRPPLGDIGFVLRHVVDYEAIAELEPYKHADIDTVLALLEEAGRFMAEVVAPTNKPGDEQGSQRRPDGSVVTPEGFKEAYAQYVAAGWGAVPFDPEYGGGGVPRAGALPPPERLTHAHMALSVGPPPPPGAPHMLQHPRSGE